jgi:hypothetical protein
MNNKRSEEWWAMNGPQKPEAQPTPEPEAKTPEQAAEPTITRTKQRMREAGKRKRQALKDHAAAADEAVRRGKERAAQSKPSRARGHMPPFEASDEQRRVVALCSGFLMSRDELRLLVINPRTKRAITMEVLESAFAVELENGRAFLKNHIATRYIQLLSNPERNERAVLWGLERIWKIPDPDRAQVGVAINQTTDGQTQHLSVEFILPDKPADKDSLSPSSPQPIGHAQQRGPHSSTPSPPYRIEPRADDVVIEKTIPSAWKKKRGSADWME